MTLAPDVLKATLDRIAGGESVKKISVDLGYEPTALYRLLRDDEAFAHQYARAREAQAHVYAADIVDISDDDALAPDDRRVRIDARKWAASKLAPKKYGDKIVNEHTGKDGGAIEVKWED